MNVIRAFDIIRTKFLALVDRGGFVTEWLACWIQAQKGLGSNRSHNAVG